MENKSLKGQIDCIFGISALFSFKHLQSKMTPESRLEMRKMVGFDDRDVADLFEDEE